MCFPWQPVWILPADLSGNSNHVSEINLRFWAFESPPPLRNFQSLLLGEYGYFLELHNNLVFFSNGCVVVLCVVVLCCVLCVVVLCCVVLCCVVLCCVVLCYVMLCCCVVMLLCYVMLWNEMKWNEMKYDMIWHDMLCCYVM